jgi:hypothetical protein
LDGRNPDADPGKQKHHTQKKYQKIAGRIGIIPGGNYGFVEWTVVKLHGFSPFFFLTTPVGGLGVKHTICCILLLTGTSCCTKKEPHVVRRDVTNKKNKEETYYKKRPTSRGFSRGY